MRTRRGRRRRPSTRRRRRRSTPPGASRCRSSSSSARSRTPGSTGSQKTGATVVTYMAQNAYLVHAERGPERARSPALAGDDAVRAVTPFTAADKTDPGVPGSGTAKVAVADARRARRAQPARRVLAAGDELEGDAAYGATVTTSVAIDSDRRRRARRRSGGRRHRALGGPEAARRARGADRRRPSLTGGHHAHRRRATCSFLTDEGFPRTPQHVRASTSPTRASTRASSRCPPDRTRTSTATATRRSRAGSCTRTRPPPPMPTPATAAATGPTSPRSPPGSTTQTGARGRGRAGLQLRARASRRDRSSARRRSSTAPATSTSTTSITALHNPAYASRRPDLQQLVGRGRRRRLQRPARRSSTPSSATPQPGVAGNQQIHRGRLRRQLRRRRRTRSAPRGRRRT